MKEKRLLWVLLAAASVLLLGIFAIWRLSSTPAVQDMVTEPSAQLMNTTQDNTEPKDTGEPTEADPTSTPGAESTDQTEPTESSEPTGQTEPTDEGNPSHGATAPPISTSGASEPTEPTEPTVDPQQRIDELIALAYELRDEYKARLAQIESDALAQFDALPADKRTRENKESIIRAAVNEAYALEEECDGRITDICDELSYLLLDTRGDMYLISELRYAYAAEKNAVRNDFLERYSEYLG